MYKKVSTDMNFVDREKETEKFWEDNHIFEKSMEDREGCPQYMFYDGPPTANGKPHIGHEYIHTIYSKSRCPMHYNIRTCFLRKSCYSILL